MVEDAALTKRDVAILKPAVRIVDVLLQHLALSVITELLVLDQGGRLRLKADRRSRTHDLLLRRASADTERRRVLAGCAIAALLQVKCVLLGERRARLREGRQLAVVLGARLRCEVVRLVIGGELMVSVVKGNLATAQRKASRLAAPAALV